MKFWWWTGEGSLRNFGDVLTPAFLNYFKIPYTYSKDFDAISIGSIAKVARAGTIVLGSGFIHSRDPVCPTANWHFVRGPYSREKIINAGGHCPDIYGDPSLMLPLICDESKKQHDVGLVPHYSQYNRIKEEYPNYYVINLLTDDPLTTAKEITKCRTIISSSLHGIICAHAYNIPVAWCKFNSGLKGDDIKFRDHYASVNLEAISSSFEDPLFTIGKFNITPMVNIFNSFTN